MSFKCSSPPRTIFSLSGLPTKMLPTPTLNHQLSEMRSKSLEIKISFLNCLSVLLRNYRREIHSKPIKFYLINSQSDKFQPNQLTFILLFWVIFCIVSVSLFHKLSSFYDCTFVQSILFAWHKCFTDSIFWASCDFCMTNFFSKSDKTQLKKFI